MCCRHKDETNRGESPTTAIAHPIVAQSAIHSVCAGVISPSLVVSNEAVGRESSSGL